MGFLGVLGFRIFLFWMGLGFFSSLAAETIRCEIVLSRIGGLLDIQMLINPPFVAEASKYSGVLTRKTPKGNIRIDVTGVSWPGTFGYEVHEKIVDASGKSSTNSAGSVLFIPHANYTQSQLVPFDLKDGESIRIPMDVPLTPDEQGYFKFALQYLAQVLVTKTEWELVNLEWSSLNPQSDMTKFAELRGPSFDEHEPPLFVEEISKEAFIKDHLEKNFKVWEELTTKLQAAGLRFFHVVESDQSISYYVMIYHELSRHILHLRLREAS